MGPVGGDRFQDFGSGRQTWGRPGRRSFLPSHFHPGIDHHSLLTPCGSLPPTPAAFRRGRTMHWQNWAVSFHFLFWLQDPSRINNQRQQQPSSMGHIFFLPSFIHHTSFAHREKNVYVMLRKSHNLKSHSF